MYSQQILRVNHDEWLRYAESRRMVKQARETARRLRPRRIVFSAPAPRRPLRHA